MADQAQRELAKRAIGLVDLTDLSDAPTPDGIDALCAAAQTPQGPVAAVCVWPEFVAQARGRLAGSGVKVATVVNFPDGGEDTEAVVAETKACLADGADEIDLVIPYRAAMEGRSEAAGAMVGAIKAVIANGAHLKVILETGELKSPELIRTVSEIALAAGADFLKTSTGKVPVNATPEAAEILITAIRDSGRDAGFKAAGGIKTVDDAAAYLAIADRIMGTEWATAKTFRFGASSLLGALLDAAE